mmetsp:Transcript_167095/g.536624  ORF Transcript_167095/g.536624 Transcript_167095/m.536624 type:complete len:241 (-) Transcript_167095:2472-3194(-)
MHRGAELDEEELPAHLKAPVAEVRISWRNEYDAHEHAAEADDVDEHTDDAHDEHRLPFAAAPASDRVVHRQGRLAVGVRGALEEDQGQIHDRVEKREHQRHEDVGETVAVHVIFHISGALSDDERDALQCYCDEEQEDGDEGLGDQVRFKAREACAFRLEDRDDIVHNAERVQNRRVTRRQFDVAIVRNVGDLIVVQANEEQAGGGVLPRLPLLDAVTERLIHAEDDGRGQEQRNDREEN